MGAINGKEIGANSGAYTAYVCSGGKYNSASIPGLKKAREERVKARLECNKARDADCGAALCV
jgi:hypothetical protein